MFHRNNIICLLNIRYLKYVNTRLISGEFKNRIHSILQSAMDKEDGRKIKQKMEKNPQKLRHVAYREKRGPLPAPGMIDLHVIGSGGRGNPKSVLLITSSNASYLFNCGEGTQRMTYEKKFRLSKLENIFITQKSWENIGGLFGTCLTLESYGVPVIKLHGPPGIENVTRETIVYAENSRVFIEKQRVWRKGFSDENISVNYVPLLPEDRERHYQNNSDLVEDETDKSSPNTERMECSSDKANETIEISSENTDTAECSSETDKVKDKTTEDTEEGPPAKKRKYTVFSPLTDPNVTMAYIVKPQKKAPPIDIEKCVELGLTRGPMIGRLKDGESVTLDDGTVIYPEQVCNKAEVCKPILFVECPSEDHLYSLLESKQISELYHDDDNGAEVVVHMSPATVVENERYQTFIHRFPSSTIHLYLNEKTSNFSSMKILRNQTWLNMLHPTIFPKIYCIEPEPTEQENHVIAKPFLRYSYRPKKALDWDNCIPTDDEEYRQTITDNEDIMKSITDFHSLLSTKQVPGDEKMYPEVVFLGTGSAIPSTNRNVTGILLNIEEDLSIILDCGEGTAGQLYRTYGEQTDNILSKIKAIFVSHLHPDHHLGLVGILNARSAALERLGKPEEPVLLCAPIQMKNWLNINQEQFGVIRQKLSLVPLQFLMKEPYKIEKHETTPYLIEKVTEKLNLKEFLPVPVIHNKHACGVSITHKSGWKIVYSGDTRPCKALVETGKDCDLLIHEATLEDEFLSDATWKKHSTFSEAVDIGKRMKAKFIILTHFSQRYPKIPLFENKYDYPVGLAFDHMKVKLHELNVLSDMISPLQMIFQEEIQFLKDRTERVVSRKNLKFASSKSKQYVNKESSTFTEDDLEEPSEEKDTLLKQSTSS